jgi:putative tryptophan/tyrosine transport system substrate-binding protein
MKGVAAVFLALAFAASVSLPAAAQQAAKPIRIGILSPAQQTSTKSFDAFREGLRGLGYIDGENITIEYRLAAGDLSRLPAMAADLVRLPVDVILTDGPKAGEFAHEATQTIPIVFRRRGCQAACAAPVRSRPGEASAR